MCFFLAIYSFTMLNYICIVSRHLPLDILNQTGHFMTVNLPHLDVRHPNFTILLANDRCMTVQTVRAALS